MWTNSIQDQLRLNRIIYTICFLIIIFLSLSLLFYPLVITIDSIYGFLAYKGTLATHHFNVLQEVSGTDISKQNELFVSWWSPGQWILPGLFTSLFGWPLGISSIIATTVCSIAGMIGYRQLFKFWKFGATIINLSLLLLIAGYSFFQNFIFYQGGEIISFAIFPWFVWYVLKIEKINAAVLLKLSILILLCFMAKTTLIIYCGLVIGYKTFSASTGIKKTRWLIACLLFLFITGLIYWLYLRRGPAPAFFDHFNFNFRDVLVPLSSPLTALFSLQLLGDQLAQALQPYTGLPVLFIIYLGFSIGCFFLLYRMVISPHLSKNYKQFLAWLYLGVAAFFTLAYLMNANIDYSVRHFKLMSFVFLPAVVQMTIRFAKVSVVLIVSFSLICFTLIYTHNKHNWAAGRFITNNFFYSNYNDLGKADNMDKATYDRLIELDKKLKGAAAVICVQASPNIALDLATPTIFSDTQGEFENKVYHGRALKLYIILPSNSINTHLAWMKKKFPDYQQYNIIDQTATFLFYESQ